MKVPSSPVHSLAPLTLSSLFTTHPLYFLSLHRPRHRYFSLSQLLSTIPFSYASSFPRPSHFLPLSSLTFPFLLIFPSSSLYLLRHIPSPFSLLPAPFLSRISPPSFPFNREHPLACISSPLPFSHFCLLPLLHVGSSVQLISTPCPSARCNTVV